MEKGKLIVVEGACDGVGKTTQVELLREYLEQYGEVIAHHFPTYHETSGFLVEKYLAGEFGDLEELSPYFINSLYAIDRAIVSKDKIIPALDEGKTVLLDRYTTSSVIYQAASLPEYAKKDFIEYVMDFEYNRLGIKKPDIVIFLTAPYEVIEQIRNARKVNDGIQKDIHESNKEYLKTVYDTAQYACELLDWKKVECSNGNQMRPIEEIHEDIIKLIKM